jgi:hypothetical protein
MPTVVVVGTGDPSVDIPAVQAAVNTPGTPLDVILKGHFSFNSPPTIPTAAALVAVGYPKAMVLVSNAVTISGEKDASIEVGTIPFYVEAPGDSVTIQGLRFCNPTAKAIVVYAANGVMIANCKIEGVVPLAPLGSSGIDIDTIGTVPKPPPPPGNAGQPLNIVGRLLVVHNEIDMTGGTSADNTLGIVVFSVGVVPDNEVDVYVYGNKIKNTTQPAINLRHIGGRVVVERNEIHTGPVSGQAPPPDVIRAANDGSYVIAHNTIHCEWPDPQAIGIGVFSQIPSTPPWNMENAVVIDNTVTMSPPAGVTFGPLGAGIDIRGYAYHNLVANNTVRGNGRAALAVDFFREGAPGNNALIQNDVAGFVAATADIVIGPNVTDTVLIEQAGTVQDNGVNTIIV